MDEIVKKKKIRPENFKGNKNSGRKTDAEIVRHYINTGLANSVINDELNKIKKKSRRSLKELTAIVMPIVLKGIVEKKDIRHFDMSKLFKQIYSHSTEYLENSENRERIIGLDENKTVETESPLQDCEPKKRIDNIQVKQSTK
ncbi:MAG: hypothetical protein AABW88_00380 [Nanoarchaeota archaeon]